MGIYKRIQAASLCSCAITRHLELRERFKGNVINELKEELMKLKKTDAKEIRSLEDIAKKAEDKCSTKEKE